MTVGLVPASYNQLSLHPVPDSNSDCIAYTSVSLSSQSIVPAPYTVY